MNIKDRILNFKRFAITNMTSIYNEDAVTGGMLALQNANKMRECLETVDALATAIGNMAVLLDYNQEDEELQLTIQTACEEIKAQANASYTSLYNEDAMTTLEREGCMAAAINECVKTINMLSDLVLMINDKIALDFITDEEMLVIKGGN